MTLATLACPAFAANPEAPIEAVWKPQRATFVYVGQTTFYTCSALEQKLTLVLRVIGAHDDIVFDRRECNTHGSTRLHVVFKSPIEATPDNIQAITTYETEQSLIARVNGAQLPSAEDLERFPASWKQISFATDRKLRMSAGDCEFIEQVRRQLLPHVSARVITNRVFCTPGAHAVRAPRLVVSTLVADGASH
jgi:hypothetical protein